MDLVRRTSLAIAAGVLVAGLVSLDKEAVSGQEGQEGNDATDDARQSIEARSLERVLWLRDQYGFSNDERTLAEAVSETASAVAEIDPASTPRFTTTDEEWAIISQREEFSSQTAGFFENVAEQPGYAGHVSEGGGDRYTIYFAAEDLEEGGRFTEEFFPDPSRVQIAEAPFSQSQILGFEADFEDHVQGNPNVVSVGIRPPAPVLVVFVSELTTEAEIALIRSLTPLELEVERSSGFEPTVCTSQNTCNDPRQAGVRVTRTTTGFSCTSGPVMRIGTDEFTSSAAHCWANETAGNIDSGPGNFFGTLTGNVSFLNDSTPESDSRLIQTTNSSTTNAWYNNNAITIRHGYAQINTNTIVCLRSPFSSVSPNCGNVHSWNHELDYACCPPFALSIAVNDVDCPLGASGGIYTSVNGPTAVGIQSGRESSVGDRCAFSHIHYVENDTGSTLSLAP